MEFTFEDYKVFCKMVGSKPSSVQALNDFKNIIEKLGGKVNKPYKYNFDKISKKCLCKEQADSVACIIDYDTYCEIVLVPGYIFFNGTGTAKVHSQKEFKAIMNEVRKEK